MSTHLDLHLHTNYCPSDEEIGQIRSYPAAERARLVDIENSLRKLQSTRDELAERIAAYDALVSPARRIPADLWQEIFVAGLPTYRNCAMSSMEGPLLYGRICSGWRAIVIQSPRLWASLHVVEPPTSMFDYRVPPTTYEQMLAQRLGAVKLWLERSGQLPLSISYHQEDYSRAWDVDPPPETATARSVSLLTALIPYASRWKKLDLQFPIHDRPEAVRVLEGLTPIDVPLLQSFSLNSSDRHWDSEQDEFELDFLSFLRSPSLTGLAFNAVGYSKPLLPLLGPVQWSQITNLNITLAPSDAVAADVLHVISGCPALKSLSVNLELVWDNSVVTIPDSDAPAVFCAELRDIELNGIQSILSFITCPQLRSLAFGTESQYVVPSTRANVTDPRPILHVLATAPLLEALYFRGGVSKECFFGVLPAIPPTLQHLEIIDLPASQVDAELLEAITRAAAERLHALAVLTLHGCDVECLPVPSLVAFLTSQSQSQYKFRALKTTYTFPLPETPYDLRAQFAPFMDAGVTVSIKHSPTFALCHYAFAGAKLSAEDEQMLRAERAKYQTVGVLL
ncbi:hypothetical protein MKEN_00939400 [Mycena kentingensis (nom. inval.)]|nr:hypothetical protein MKEN_00939400 [Mycena kentingensis (nom. inval.)]